MRSNEISACAAAAWKELSWLCIDQNANAQVKQNSSEDLNEGRTQLCRASSCDLPFLRLSVAL